MSDDRFRGRFRSSPESFSQIKQMPDSAPTAVDARLGGVGHGVTLSGVEAIDSPASSVAVSVSPAAPPPLPCVLPHVSSGGAAETPLLPGDAKKAEAREYTADEQHLTLHDLAARYATRVDEASPSKSLGLTSAEAAALLAQHGPNRLTPPKGVPEWYKFVICFTDPFMVALLVAGGFCFVAYGVGNLNDRTNAILGGVLWGLVFATCTLTYIQGRQTSAVMSSFTKMLPSQCTIVRDGRESVRGWLRSQAMETQPPLVLRCAAAHKTHPPPPPASRSADSWSRLCQVTLYA